MKVNFFTLFLSVLLSALISYFFSYYYLSIETKIIIGVGSFITLFISGTSMLSVSFEYERTTFLTRITSAIFFGIFVITEILFLTIGFSLPVYVLVNGCLLLFLLLIIYGIAKSKH